MDIDMGLWAILAAGIAFIWCGCVYTGDRKKPSRGAVSFERDMDKAA